MKIRSKDIINSAIFILRVHFYAVRYDFVIIQRLINNKKVLDIKSLLD
jgi:hypothetical protein